MLDIKLIRENPNLIKKNLEKREIKTTIVDEVLLVDKKFRELKQELDSLKSQKNTQSKEISNIKKQGGDIKKQLSLVKEIADKITKKESQIAQVLTQRDEILISIPNLLDKEVPIGKDEEDNVPIEFYLEKPQFDFTPKTHNELCLLNDWYDLESAAKNSGARFYYLKNELVELQLALYLYVMNKLNNKGYSLIEVPPMLRRSAIGKSVCLEDFEEVIYKIEDEDLYMVGTSEHALAVLHRDQLLNHKDLPKKYAGISNCFRKEAGVTKDSKGIFRVHNFNKIEQFIFCEPQESEQYHKEITQNAKDIFKELELHYQIVDICTGDIGSFASRKFDLEAWLPGQDKYREMVSASNYRDYGARRLNCRYQDKNNKINFVHTLNSTAIALTRAIIAIIEQHQTKDGNVKIPKILRPYMSNREYLLNR
ncbi:MAG: serine--tRNA ligase [Nanoarchaeota archaeon]